MGVNTTKLIGYALFDGGLTVTQAVGASNLGVGAHTHAVDKLRAASLIEPDPTYLFTTKALGYSLRQDRDPVICEKLTGQSLLGPISYTMPGAKLVAYTLYTDQFAPIQTSVLRAQSQGGVGALNQDLDKLLGLAQIAVGPRQTSLDKATAYTLLDEGSGDSEPTFTPRVARFTTLVSAPQIDLSAPSIVGDLLLDDGSYGLLDDAVDHIRIAFSDTALCEITLRGRSTTRGRVTYRITHHETPLPDRIALEVNPQGAQPLIRMEDGSYFLSETQSVARYNNPNSDV